VRLDAIERAYPRVHYLIEPTWRATRASRPPVMYANGGFTVRDLRGAPIRDADLERVPIYGLEPGSTTATPATSAIAATWSGDALVVRGDRTRWDYEVLFPLVKVTHGARLRATCDIEVTAGGMLFGVLDKKAERWLRQERLPVGPRAVHQVDFFGCCDDVRLILCNDLQSENDGPSGAVVHEMRLDEMRPRR
jgi:hypothetical protein